MLQVRKKDTCAMYAMKVISKSFVIQKGKSDPIMTERNILTKMNNQFIVKLHYAFQSVLISALLNIIEILPLSDTRFLSGR